jgi:hypothetical protein
MYAPGDFSPAAVARFTATSCAAPLEIHAALPPTLLRPALLLRSRSAFSLSTLASSNVPARAPTSSAPPAVPARCPMALSAVPLNAIAAFFVTVKKLNCIAFLKKSWLFSTPPT